MHQYSSVGSKKLKQSRSEKQFMFEPVKKKTVFQQLTRPRKHVFNLSIKRLKLVASPVEKKVKKLKLTSE